MDKIAIAVSSNTDGNLMKSLLNELGFENPEHDFENDTEVILGFKKFNKIFNIERIFYLVKSKTDKNSNKLTQDIYQDLSEGKDSKIDLIANKIQLKNFTSDIWFLFAYSWNDDDEISYFSGNAKDLHNYMLLNCGAYRLTYILKHNKYNIDLDTPLIWKLSED